MKLIIATHNRKKAGEMLAILGERFPQLELLTLNDFPGVLEPEETGTTLEENAKLKALSALEHTRYPCVADDGGFEIDALGGQPGLHSKRFAGESTPFPEKMRLILEKMQDVPEEKRGARFRCVVALALPGEEVHVFEGVCEGKVALEPKGENGFGYDPILWVPELGCTMAELLPQQKHAISHRGKALKQLGDFLEKRLLTGCGDCKSASR
jgi:XTP/dITP diphosphohydrolase